MLLLAIGFVYINNFTLMMNPQRWLAMYHRSAAGMNLNWSDPTLAPRYLHFMLGAFAIAGLLLFVVGVWNRSTEYGQWMIRKGARYFVAPTVLNYMVGMWFLMALPRSVLIDCLPAVSVGLAHRFRHAVAARRGGARRARFAHGKTILHARLAVLTTLLTLVVMVALRQVVRTAYVSPFLRLQRSGRNRSGA